jgi:hypothetical protein
LAGKFGQEQVQLMLTYVATEHLTDEEKQAVEQLIAPNSAPHQHICMDGKTLRGSKSYTHNEKAVRMFNVLAKVWTI